jgi:DNA-binding NtrC family response regulator
LRDESTTPKPSCWKGRKILIVEEDYANFLLLHEMLACKNMQIIRAVTLNETFELLSSSMELDLLIINTGISGNEDGQTIHQIKSMKPTLPVLAVAGCSNTVKDHGCQSYGCDTCIGPNIDGQEMVMAINDLLTPVA